MSNLSEHSKSGRQKATKDGNTATSPTPNIPKDSETGFPFLQVYEQYHCLNDLIVTVEVMASL